MLSRCAQLEKAVGNAITKSLLQRLIGAEGNGAICSPAFQKAASGRLTAFAAFRVSLIARMLSAKQPVEGRVLSAGQKRMQLKSNRFELLVKE